MLRGFHNLRLQQLFAYLTWCLSKSSGFVELRSPKTLHDFLTEYVSLSFPRALTCISVADKMDFNLPFVQKELVAGSRTRFPPLS